MISAESTAIQAALMAVFHFNDDDLAANRKGRISRRQRIRLLVRKGSAITATALGTLVVGMLCTSMWVWGTLKPDQVPLRMRWNGDLGWFPILGFFALILFLASIGLGWALLKDVLRGAVQARDGRMRITPGIARVTYGEGAAKFDIHLSDRAYAKLSASASEPFACTVYRTEAGRRILSIGVD